RYDLGIYTLIVFGLLVFILSKYAWPRISEGLKKREAAIIGARDEAQKVLRDAEELRAKLQKDEVAAAERHRIEFERARKEADTIIAQARESMDKAAAERRGRAQREGEGGQDTAPAPTHPPAGGTPP